METKQRPITLRQRAVLEFIKGHVLQRGYPPTVREIADHFGFKSPLSVQIHINALIKKGYLKRSPSKQRALEILKLNITEDIPVPLLGRVRAGEPILAEENIDEYIRIDKSLFEVENGFALRVMGESMKDAGIYEGDIAIVKPDVEPKNGDIVVALIGDEATIKRFYLRKGKIVLVPENTSMKPLTLDPEGVRIIGRVTGIIRRF